MVIVELKGGLGNQMFQYAYALSLSLSRRQSLVVDHSIIDADPKRQYRLGGFTATRAKHSTLISHFLRLLRSADARVRTNLVTTIAGSARFDVLDDEQDGPRTMNCRNAYVRGYWQDPSRFVGYRAEILSEFTLSVPLTPQELELVRSHSRRPTVAMHIRGGDYVNDRTLQEHYGLCSSRYYHQALEWIESRIGPCDVRVFSDDPQYARGHLRLERPYRFVKLNNADETREQRLMTSCDHVVISNSTYSWWAAWLKEQQEAIIVAPYPWYSMPSAADDLLVPQGWKRVPK